MDCKICDKTGRQEIPVGRLQTGRPEHLPGIPFQRSYSQVERIIPVVNYRSVLVKIKIKHFINVLKGEEGSEIKILRDAVQ